LEELKRSVEWASAVVDAHQDAEGVTAQLSDGHVIRAGWLVGCDGAHSQVRKLAGIGFPGVKIVERFLLADVHAALPVARDTVSVWLSGEEMIATFPLPGADLWRLMAPARQDANHDEFDAHGVLKALTRQLHDRSGWDAATVEAAEWTSTFRIHRRLADRFRVNRILLAGDAAHIHSPLGGQGLNTGIGDAENLAWKLALVVQGQAQPALLDSYEAERRPIAADVLKSTSAMTRIVLGESRLARLVRDRVFVPSLNLRLVQRLIWEQASQLKVSYRDGPLTERSRRPLAPRPRPGDRVPDVSCMRFDGTATRLHAELGPNWVLLTPSSLTQKAARPIQDCADLLRSRLSNVTVLTPSQAHASHLLLVRPDAHLAWRGDPSTHSLAAWLTGVLDGISVHRPRRAHGPAPANAIES
jgi:4,5-epoxidase